MNNIPTKQKDSPSKPSSKDLQQSSSEKRPVGRPPTYTNMPDPILAPPEAIARAIMQRPPKKKWRYLKKKPA